MFLSWELSPPTQKKLRSYVIVAVGVSTWSSFFLGCRSATIVSVSIYIGSSQSHQKLSRCNGSKAHLFFDILKVMTY